jgi:hypothetical protein
MTSPCFHHATDPHTHDGDPAAPGSYSQRPAPKRRDYGARSFTVGIGGPVGSGKTALLLSLCRTLRDRYQLGVVTNDIFTKEDAEFLMRNEALPAERIRAVETGGCPHTAIRDDISPNLVALDGLMASIRPELLFVESGGDNLAAVVPGVYAAGSEKRSRVSASGAAVHRPGRHAAAVRVAKDGASVDARSGSAVWQLRRDRRERGRDVGDRRRVDAAQGSREARKRRQRVRRADSLENAKP